MTAITPFGQPHSEAEPITHGLAGVIEYWTTGGWREAGWPWWCTVLDLCAKIGLDPMTGGHARRLARIRAGKDAARFATDGARHRHR